MAIIDLKQRQDLADPKTAKAYKQFNELVVALQQKELTAGITDMMNSKIGDINQSLLNGKELTRLVKERQNAMLKILEKEVKLVAKNHYRNTWLVLGMSAFGLPLGVSISLTMGNIGLLGIGLPIGMVIGIAVGSNLDKKAEQEGKQLSFEPKM